jgi:hypothetical protein
MADPTATEEDRTRQWKSGVKLLRHQIQYHEDWPYSQRWLRLQKQEDGEYVVLAVLSLRFMDMPVCRWR